jgi:hypothetical protein
MFIASNAGAKCMYTQAWQVIDNAPVTNLLDDHIYLDRLKKAHSCIESIIKMWQSHDAN